MQQPHPQTLRRQLHRKMTFLGIVLAPFYFLLFLLSRFLRLLGLETWWVKKAMKGAIKDAEHRMHKGFQDYQPTKNDVFICSYPKSGTNWGMQIAYQIANHGKGEYEHIHDVVAWPDATKDGVAVPLNHEMALASLTGYRVIKTHAEAQYVPYSPEAKYVCIVRDPKDVAVSGYYFFRDVELGFLIPSIKAWVELLMSDTSLNWASFTHGYWLWRNRPNVLFLTFEEMKVDLNKTIQQIADLMGITLSAEELEKITYLSSYQYMKTIDHKFYPGKIAPLASPKGSMIRSGKKDSSGELINKKQQADIDDHSKKSLLKLGSDFPYDIVLFKKL
jgi:hypothetical protein